MGRGARWPDGDIGRHHLALVGAMARYYHAALLCGLCLIPAFFFVMFIGEAETNDMGKAEVDALRAKARRGACLQRL